MTLHCASLFSRKPVVCVGLAETSARAKQTLNEALKLNPDYAPALETLGNVRLAQQNHREAIELLQRVIKIERRRACCSLLPKPSRKLVTM